jgi:hypothetical protein
VDEAANSNATHPALGRQQGGIVKKQKKEE